jgi:ParB family chromosome partitioning protein
MAVEFNVPMTRTSEYLCLPEDVQIDPLMNGRHELPDIAALVDSILTHGQLQPVTIRRTAGAPVLVAGFSRWRAISHINKQNLAPKPLKLRCSYTQLTERQAFLANIEENRVRNATTPMDDAYNIQRLINVYQMTKEEAAESYLASVSWIKGRLSLLELTPEAEKAVREGRVKGPAAKAIAKLDKEHQKRIVERPGKVTAADVKREAPAPAKKEAKPPKPSLSVALAALLAECDQQGKPMVYDVHSDTIAAIRSAIIV